MADSLLVYHTFLSEYRGVSAEDIIQRIYEDSASGTGASVSQWWDNQKKLWGREYTHDVPNSPEEPNASQRLLEILLEVGALEVGPQKPHKPSGWER